MANIRIRDLPENLSPSPDYFTILDNGGTQKVTIKNFVDVGAPVATQTEAEAGTDNEKRMTPLTTKQAIEAIGGADFATAAQGDTADTALQPDNIGNSVQAHDALLDSVSSLALQAGDILYASGPDTVERLPKGSEGQLLQSGANAPAWTSVGSGGGMVPSVYDPQGISANAFDKANHVGFTTQDISSKTIPSEVTAFRTNGYSSPGDFGGSFFKEIPNNGPLEAGQHQSNGGTRRWAISAPEVNAEDFGAVGDDVADDSDALENAIKSGYRVLGNPKATYKITRDIGSHDINWDGRGCTIDATALGTSTFGLAFRGGENIDTYDLPSDLKKGWWMAIPVADASVLSVGDWISIYDPTDGSWNPARPNYKAGEFHTVVETDETANTIAISGNLFDDYASATSKIAVVHDPASVYFVNTTILFNTADDSPAQGLRIERAQAFRVDNVHVQGARTSVGLKSNYGGLWTGGSAKTLLNSSANSYGMIVGTSQDVDIVGADLHSNNNHAADIGGGELEAIAVNRNVRYLNCTLNGKGYAASMHGNTEFCGYDGGFANGVIIAGDHNFFRNMGVNTNLDDGSGIIRGTELLGLNHDISHLDIVVNKETSSLPGPPRIFDFSGGGMITEDTLRGGHLSIVDNNVRVDTDESAITFFRLRNNGSTATNLSAEFARNTVEVTGGATVTPIEVSRASASESLFADVWNYDNKLTGTIAVGSVNAVVNYNRGHALPIKSEIPTLTPLFASNSSLSANSSVELYNRSGETEVLCGTVFGQDITITVEIDGEMVLDSRTGGSVVRQRGQTSDSAQFSVHTIPWLHARSSVVITAYEENGSAQSVGMSGFVMEHS